MYGLPTSLSALSSSWKNIAKPMIHHEQQTENFEVNTSGESYLQGQISQLSSSYPQMRHLSNGY